MDNLQVPKVPQFFQTESAKTLQQSRLANFANYTAEKTRETHNCAFSKKDQTELVQSVTTWYESCAQGMLSGNYSLIDQWVRKQGRAASEQKFALEDFLQFLRICRSSAIEIERWNAEALLVVDDVINEALRRGFENPSWKISADMDYRGTKEATAPSIAAKTPAAEAAPTATPIPIIDPASERRLSNRTKMQVPIRVSGDGITGYRIDVIVQTENLSSTGLYFQAYEPFSAGLPLRVSYQYSKDPNAPSKAFTAKVVRVDRKNGRHRGIAIRF